MKIVDVKGNLRKKLTRRYRNGGVEFEDDVRPRMGNISPHKYAPIIDQRSGKLIYWVYVGDFYWARKVRNKYHFGKLYAVENRKGSTDKHYDALWDERRHAHKPDPVIIYHNGRRGVIIGWNKFEIFVNFDDDPNKIRIPLKFGDLRFEYIEDYRKFDKLFSQ